MRRKSLVQRAILATAALITATGLTASGASAEETGTISGWLTASDGAGVGNASVSVDGPVFKSTTTGPDGTYSVSGVTPGPYRVRFVPIGRPQQYANSKTDYSQADVFTVAAGQTVTVNDTLLPVGFISGRLANADGSAASFAQVTGYPMSGGSSGFASTAPDGTYSMAVPPGNYRVQFRLQSGLYQYAFGTLSWNAAAIIAVPSAGETVTVNDTVVPTGVLAGRVFTSTGVPVAEADVDLSNNSHNFTTRTDVSGNYRFTQAPPGAYRVAVRPRTATGTGVGMRMYAPQTQDPSDAQLYTVTAGQETSLNITLLPTGTVAGRFTSGGAGVAGVGVSVSNDLNSAFTTTNSNGDYQIPDVFGGNYRVLFNHEPRRIRQYAHGKVSAETAQVFTLTPGTTLTVNDTQLPTGTLRVTARDALTGAQIQSFNVDLNFAFWGSTENGVVSMPDIPQGTYPLSIYAQGYTQAEQQVTITGGQQTNVALSLSPLGTIPLTVVDAGTGAPVANVCVFLQYPERASVPDGCDGTDEHGRVDLHAPTGSYTILALPDRRTAYGAQWVGPNGGTGDQRQAAVVSIVNGQTAAARTIRLDRAGSIAGRVTSETGQFEYGQVGLLTVYSAVGGPGYGTEIAADGTYRLDGLGPYEWPLLLQTVGHADQWSGVKDNRFEAQKIKVTSGGTATYDHVLKVGTTVLTGTVKDRNGEQMEGWLGVFNPVTGDFAGQTWMWDNEPFQIRLLGPAQVKIYTDPYWFNGTSSGNAGLLKLGTGTTTVKLCAVGPTTMWKCVRELPTPTLPPRTPMPTPTPPAPSSALAPPSTTASPTAPPSPRIVQPPGR